MTSAAAAANPASTLRPSIFDNFLEPVRYMLTTHNSLLGSARLSALLLFCSFAPAGGERRRSSTEIPDPPDSAPPFQIH
jgi:hypothetical protein